MEPMCLAHRDGVMTRVLIGVQTVQDAWLNNSKDLYLYDRTTGEVVGTYITDLRVECANIDVGGQSIVGSRSMTIGAVMDVGRSENINDQLIDKASDDAIIQELVKRGYMVAKEKVEEVEVEAKVEKKEEKPIEIEIDT